MNRVFRVILFTACLALPQAGTAKSCRQALGSVDPRIELAELQDPDLANLYRMVILPVLDEGGRAAFARFRFNTREKSITVTSPSGKYVIRLTRDEDEVSPRWGLPEVDIEGGKADAEITLHSDTAFANLDRSKDTFRSALRTDRYLHPQQRPGDGEEYAHATLSFPQRDALSALIAMESDVKGKKGIKRGLIMPPGMGKTVVSAKFVDAVGKYNKKRRVKGWGKPPKILYVVENNQILDRSVETFKGELGIDKDRVSKIYDEGSQDEIKPNARMVAITRSSYFTRADAIHDLMKQDPDQPWVIIFDEAHHLGKADGQFDEIRRDLDQTADSRHRILLLSATPWHEDTPLITQYLEGHVYGSFLDKEEQTKLQNGEDLPLLSRLQLYRGIQRGYLSPLYGLNLIKHVGNLDTRTLLASTTTDPQSGVRTVNHYRSLLKDVASRIRKNHVPGLPDRGVIYVDSIARANLYAKELSKRLGAEVRPFHTGEGVDPTTFDWFSDKNQFATDKERKTPKYLVVVDILKEGVDIPGINMLILMRTYGADMGGFRELLQTIGRALRNHANGAQLKPHFRLLDYSTYARWLRDGLEQISVEPRNGPKTRSRSGRGYVVVDHEILDPLHFLNQYFNLFPKEGSFVQEFPFFDLDVFKSDGVAYLHELAGSFGIKTFGNKFGVKKLILRIAAGLPDSPEKGKLITELKDNKKWGWTQSDGVEAKQKGEKGAPAAQRIYRALYRIAALEKLSSAGRALDLTKIHRASELEKLADLLLPNRVRSLTGQEERASFFDKQQGAWSVIAHEVEERNLGKASDVGAMGKLFEALLGNRPPSPAKAALLKRLRKGGDLALGIRDGLVLNSSGYAREQTHLAEGYVRTHGSLQRVYRAFYALAQFLKETEGAPIDLSKLHTRAETEKVLNLLNADRVGIILDPARKSVFLDEDKGSLRLFASQAKFFGISTFTHRFGSRDFLLGLAKWLPKSKEKNDLIADLRNDRKWEWGLKDGSMIMEDGYDNPTSRFFRGLSRIAKLLNQLQPEAKIDLQRLHEKAEGQRFIDQLVLGFDVPTATDRDLSWFASHVTPVLEDRANDFGISAYVSDFGPKRLALALAKRLVKKAPGSALAEKLLESLDDDTLWGWRKGDGDMMKHGTSPRAVQNYHRALSAIAVLFKQIDPATGVDPSLVDSTKGIKQLLDRLQEISMAQSRVR